MRTFKLPKIISLILCVAFFGMSYGQKSKNYQIKINNYNFDPLIQIPDTAALFSIANIEKDSTYKLLQFKHSLTREEVNTLNGVYGLKLDQYIPNYTYLEYVSNDQVRKIASLPYFRWAGNYKPEYKLARNIGENSFVTDARIKVDGIVLILVLRKNASGQEVENELKALNLSILKKFNLTSINANNRLRVRINNLNDLNKIAQIPDVIWIEEEGDITIDNGGVTTLIQSNNATNTPLYNVGIRGEGQIVGVIDNPLDLDHCFFVDGSNPTAGPGHRKVVGIRADNPTTFTSPANSTSGHGTHTSGTVAGFDAGGTSNGIAFNSRLTHGDLNDLSLAGGTRTFLEYLNLARNDGASIHSNSWSDKASGAINAYTTLSQDLDNFTWNNEDQVVVVSSGNNIGSSSSPIRPPFSSKNGLCVAASSEGNTNDVSTGALGPTFDNRRKPDIYAPGSNTNSARAGTTCNTFNINGSSMATPAIAGAAALVRQYYLEGWYPTGTQQPHHAFIPSGALIKATMLNSTRDMTGTDANGATAPVNGYPTDLEGWGGLVLDDALYFNSDARNLMVWDVRNNAGLMTGEQQVQTINIVASTQALKITLNWTEPPATTASFGTPVINNLDLIVTAPDGTVYTGNDFTSSQSTANGTTADLVNNVEMALINTPQIGNYTIQIQGTAVNEGPQGYALVVTADMIEPPAPTGNQNTMVVLTELPGTTPAGAPAQPNAQNLIDEVNTYINEVSYAQTTINPSYKNVTLTSSLGSYLSINSNPLIEMTQDVVSALLVANPNVFNQGTPSKADDIDRIMILLNDVGFTGDWATTGPWPYDLPTGLTERLSVSISSVFNDPARRLNHAVSHQMGMVDLYNHPGVVFAQPHVDNWDIMGNLNEVQPLAWSKERALWLSTHNANSIRWIPRPNAGASFSDVIPLNWLSSTSTDNPRAIAFGLTPGVTNIQNENVFYFVEARTRSIGSTDDLIPEDNAVLLYYVNENITQGEGPVRIIDEGLGTSTLDDAAFGLGPIPSPGGTGLDLEVLSATGTEAFRIQVDYDPPETDNDINIRIGNPSWTSPDIWVDSQVDGFDEDNGRTPQDRGDNPIAGEDNRIYFTVHNPGPGDAFDITVSVRISEPYHTIGGEPDFNRYVNQKYYPRIDAGTSVTDYVIWKPNDQDVETVHSCILVEIHEVFNDVNDFNNKAQQNTDVKESGTASPYEPVEFDFSVTNPYDYYQLFYFRLEGLPQGWTYNFAEHKKRLSAHERYEGSLTITPPDDAQVCTDHTTYVTSWMPKGNTLVQYGGTTLQINLRNRTTLTINNRLIRCDKEVDIRGNVDSQFTTQTYQSSRPKCFKIVTQGCTDPIRANEEIVLRYEDPNGNPVYRVVMTDEHGCYSDTYVVTDGGEWEVSATYKGDDCSGSTTTGRVPVFVPIPTFPGGLFPGAFGKNWWFSAHVGSSHPLGALNDNFDANIYAAIDFTTPINDNFNLTFILGLAQKTSEINTLLEHQRYYHLSGNVEWNFGGSGGMKPYVRLGPGYYRDKNSINLVGVNFGLGGKTKINDNLIISPGMDYHFIGLGQDRTESFLSFHLGIIFK